MASTKSKVAPELLHATLRGYRAEIDRDSSNGKKHVYFSRPLQKWITVRRKGTMFELEFTNECPCVMED